MLSQGVKTYTRPSSFVIFIFLAPVFLNTLSRANASTGESPYISLQLDLISIGLITVAVGWVVAFRRIPRSTSQLAIAGLVTVLALSCMSLFFRTEAASELAVVRSVPAFLVELAMVISTLLFAGIFYSGSQFTHLVFWFCRVSAGLALAAWVLWEFAELPVAQYLVIPQSDVSRLKGLVMEPSAWAGPVVAYFLIAAHKRKKVDMLLAVVTAF